MAELLRDGASSTDGGDERAHAHLVAEAVWEFLAPCYGPGGGMKLMPDEHLVSGGAALREMPIEEPAVAPYQRLATEMERLGDGSALACLLAAGVVARVAQRPRRRIASALEGIGLARRQLTGILQSLARSAPTGEAFEGATGIPAALLDQLPALAVDGHIELDRVDVQAGPVATPTWSPGLLVEPKARERTERDVRIAVLDTIELPRARTAVGMRLQRIESDEATIEALRVRLRERADLIVCRKGIPEDVEARLVQDGLLVVTDAPTSLTDRLRIATGARLVSHIAVLEPQDIGQGRMTPRGHRDGRWVLTGDGPSATIEVPSGAAEQVDGERVRRWLRLAGNGDGLGATTQVLEGGGRWQRTVARQLRGVSGHAPGASAIGIDAVAKTFDAIADSLVANMGLDPLDERVLGPRHDLLGTTRTAITLGLELAVALLRIDGRYAKRPSAGAEMRGGTGPSGSLKGMPGDIPPLM